MASSFTINKVVSCIILALYCLSAVYGQLRPAFYKKSCRQALWTVKAAVKEAMAKEPRMAASLLRLHFHDCFVNGCDGSVLLDDTPNFTGEKNAAPNINSLRGFDVIDNIKTRLENVCSGVVSCADILAMATRDAVVESGGSTWTIGLGRRDSRTASQTTANTNLPSASSNLSTLVSVFGAQGLSAKDMVALSGAHTIGQARCLSFRNRIYNESNIDKEFASSVQANCPLNKGLGDNELSVLDVGTPVAFDNGYYKNLRSEKGLFHSDQELFNGGFSVAQVVSYSTDQNAFFIDFAAAMVKMGNIKPLTGRRGEIRKHCRRRN